MSKGFWRITWIQEIFEDLFWEGSGFKRKMELIRESTQIRIGTLRKGTDALPSVPKRSAS
jgi:hypothetical protein